MKDREAVELYHQALRCTNNIHPICDGMFQSSIHSKRMVHDLEQLGCVPAKSLILRFPELPQNLVRHFVLGYLDGDGCVSLHNKWQRIPQLRYSFVGTREFLAGIQKVLNREGHVAGSGKAFRLEYNGNGVCRRIADWMYEGASIYLQRKKEAAYSYL
jgi:hypothetical protein